MPSVESGGVEIFLIWNGDFVELFVVGVNESDVLQALILLVESIADDLDLSLVRDCLQVGVKN